MTFESWERERTDRAVGVIATVGPGGVPHAAPVQVWWEGDALRFETEFTSAKYRHLAADPKVCVCVYGAPKWGVVIQGTAEVLTQPEAGGQAQIRVHPLSKASWRRKEG